MNFAVPATLITALAGALVGALINAYLRHRGDRRAARETLVGEIAIFGQECIAALMELYAASFSAEDAVQKWGKQAAVSKLIGRGMALEIRVFRECRQRLARAAIHKLVDRVETVADAMRDESGMTEQEFKIAVSWIGVQLSNASSLMSKVANIDMTDKARPYFVGFRKVTLEDKLALSFDKEPLPWKYALAIQLDDEVPGVGLDTIRRRTRERVAHLRCPTHGYAAHVIMTGLSSNMTISFDVCCTEFGSLAHSKLVKSQSNE